MIKSCKKQKTISKELLPVVKEMEVNICRKSNLFVKKYIWSKILKNSNIMKY